MSSLSLSLALAFALSYPLLSSYIVTKVRKIPRISTHYASCFEVQVLWYHFGEPVHVSILLVPGFFVLFFIFVVFILFLFVFFLCTLFFDVNKILDVGLSKVTPTAATKGIMKLFAVEGLSNSEELIDNQRLIAMVGRTKALLLHGDADTVIPLEQSKVGTLASPLPLPQSKSTSSRFCFFTLLSLLIALADTGNRSPISPSSGDTWRNSQQSREPLL